MDSPVIGGGASKTRRFGRAIHGSTAIIFALCAATFAGLIGLAVDYGRGARARERLQVALDNAVIAAAARKAAGHTDGQTTMGNAMAANWVKPDGSDTPVLSYQEIGNDTVAGSASVNLPTTFSRILGRDSIELGVRSQATFGTSAVEIALVLDTTGSMSGSKIAALQSASNQLITQAYAGPNAANQVKIGIVPFAQYVNIGTTYSGQSWLSNSTNFTANENVCTWVQANPNATCTTRTGYWNNDGTQTPYTYQDCGPSVQQCSIQPVAHTWNGCVGSRAYPLDVSQPAVSNASPVPGIMDVWCAAALQRLTNDQTALANMVASLSAQGETYLPSGLIWGWRLLSNQLPFADASSPTATPRVRKVIVMMTDGFNTLAPTYPAHDDWGNAATADTLTAEACTNIKAAGIEIFAITFDVTNQPAKDRMAACASASPYYFDAQSNAQLVSFFDQIGRSLSPVRLAR